MKKLTLALAVLLIAAEASAQVYPYFPPPNMTYDGTHWGPLSSMPQVPNSSIIGNASGGTASPSALTPLAVINMTQVMMIAHLVSVSTNVTLSGTQTIDGVATGNGTVVLLRAQTTASQNGIWLASSGGAWSRPAWYPSGYVIPAGCDMDVFIEAGSTFANTVWAAQPASAATIDTTATTWNEITVAASATRLGTVLTTAGLSTKPAAQYLANITPSGTVHDCASFADTFGSIADNGDFFGVTGPCATLSPTTAHLNLENGGFPPSASSGTLNVNSADHWGVITGLTGASSVTVTFSSPFPSGVASCTANGSTGIAWGVGYTTVAGQITAATFTPAVAFTGTLSYHCFGVG